MPTARVVGALPPVGAWPESEFEILFKPFSPNERPESHFLELGIDF